MEKHLAPSETLLTGIPISEWKWRGRAGHFISSDLCRYRLATTVGAYIVSTVGDLHRTRAAAKMEKINQDGYYETMVFRAGEIMECGCRGHDGREIEVQIHGEIKCDELDKRHFDMCLKYAKIQE